MTAEEKLEAMELIVFEIDAISSILCCDDDGYNQCCGSKHTSEFVVRTPDALQRMRLYLEEESNAASNKGRDEECDISQIDAKAFVKIRDETTNSAVATSEGIQLRISLPPGYPTHASTQITILSTPKKIQNIKLHRDELSLRLQRKAEELLGMEAIMELVNECRDGLMDWYDGANVNGNGNTIFSSNDAENDNINSDDNCCCSEPEKQTKETKLGRRWIWVHHITNTDQSKSIVNEAQSLNLGGFVKRGFPGVIVIEGSICNCDEFVSWVKGSKNRPGGFGRNWGHHVRGEMVDDERSFPLTTMLFQELEDDMGKLGVLCKEFGVEDEFREFILQHNK